jgi:hypothetical protein
MQRNHFLNLWSPKVRRQLEELMAEDLAEAYSAEVNESGQLVAKIWINRPESWDHDRVYEPGKTERAIQLVDKGWSAYKASQHVGVSQAAVSRALKARRYRQTCECCGQPVKNS